jgi:hypothetical protein
VPSAGRGLACKAVATSRLSRVRRRPATVALVAWTFLVWTTRVGTIWEDDELSGAGKVGRTALALSFTLLALAVVVTLVRRSTGGRPTTTAVDALAAWTTAVWAVRAPGIVLADHGAAFTIVHLVLAAVSIVLAYLAFREARRPAPTAPDAGAPAVRAPTG